MFWAMIQKIESKLLSLNKKTLVASVKKSVYFQISETAEHIIVEDEQGHQSINKSIMTAINNEKLERWHHIAVTCRKGRIRFFFDGEKQETILDKDRHYETKLETFTDVGFIGNS
jgi:hypothetical protein